METLELSLQEFVNFTWCSIPSGFELKFKNVFIKLHNQQFCFMDVIGILGGCCPGY